MIAEQLNRVEVRLSELPAGLQAHVQRARELGASLAPMFGADGNRVDLAIAGHDVYRAETDQALLAEAERRGIVPDALEIEQPLLLHGPLASAWMADEGGVSDRKVLDAVRHHTTFAPGLGRLAAAVFLADKLDPDKIRRRPWLSDVDELARLGNWKSAIRAYISAFDTELKRQGVTPHPLAMESYEALGC